MNHISTAFVEPELGDPLSPRPRPGSFVLDRWEVLQLVKDTAPQTGLREREIAVLAAHLSVLTRGDIRADQLLISYAQIGGMLDRANCMDERRFRRAEVRLEELGFIDRHLSGNGRRYPVRDASGRVVDAYGIDLRPLFLRTAELRQLREAAMAEKCRLSALRSRLSARLSAIKRQILLEERSPSEHAATTLNEVRNLLRRAKVCAADLRQAEEHLSSLASDGQPDRPHDSSIGNSLSSDSSADDAGQTDRHSEPKRKDIYDSKHPDASPGNIVISSSSREAWESYQEIAAFYPDEPRTEGDLLKIIVEFCGFIGIRVPTLEKLLLENGSLALLTALNSMAAKISKIANPNGYLVAMFKGRHFYNSDQLPRRLSPL